MVRVNYTSKVSRLIDIEEGLAKQLFLEDREKKVLKPQKQAYCLSSQRHFTILKQVSKLINLYFTALVLDSLIPTKVKT